MASGYVLHLFKVGKQTSVFKSGEISIKNYRLITEDNNTSKILKKAVKDILVEY